MSVIGIFRKINHSALSLCQKNQRGFFQKLFGNSLPKVEELILKENKEYNKDYLKEDFVKYALELGVPPLNSYNNVRNKVLETDPFSQKMMFRIAAQTQIMKWASMYEQLVDSMVAGNVEAIDTLCEERLALILEEFIQKVEKSSLKLTKILPVEPLDVLVYSEYCKHKTVEGVQIERKLNNHSSEYFKTETSDKLIFDKVNAKKRSKWAILNLADQIEEGEKGENKLQPLNQYLISFQTNIKLNLVRKADESEIIYGSNDPAVLNTHFIQIENVRSYSQDLNFKFTDIDNILNGNPFVSS